MGYMINLAMFKRNGHAGYLLKPRALREANSSLLDMYSKHFFDVTVGAIHIEPELDELIWLFSQVISAQQLPRPRDKSGHEIVDRTIVDPFVCVTLYIPDWSNSSLSPASSPSLGGTDPSGKAEYTPATTNTPAQPSTARTISLKTKAIRNNGFNPVWDEKLSVPFDVVGGLDEVEGMKELIFVRFALYDDEDDEGDEPLGVYCTSLASLEMGECFSFSF
jgi:phosphatidylinositol phospholipase C delta